MKTNAVLLFISTLAAILSLSLETFAQQQSPLAASPLAQQPSQAAATVAPQAPANVATAPADAAPVPDAPKPDWMQYSSGYTQQSGDLSTAHITESEVVGWAQNIISEIFTMGADNYTDKLQDYKNKYFAKSGWKNYALFLKDSGTLEAIKQNGYSISAIIRDLPMITVAKNINGVYHWGLKVNATISFFLLTDKNEIRTIKTGNYILQISIARTNEKDKNEFALEIDDFKIEPDMSGGGY